MARRTDIQGLRAVAVLVVLLGHAGVAVFDGGFVGVDVFFVISGFLITGLLISEVDRHGRVSLTGFYGRRARRILPAASLTLVATAVASSLLLNAVRSKQYIIDSIYSAGFLANFRFSDLSTDYFAIGQPPSPVQHYWSLAIEEQFYLFWPVAVGLLTGTGLLAWRKTSLAAHDSSSVRSRQVNRRRLGVGVAAIGLSSFVWSIHTASSDQPGAYFSTAARVWELALGSALAVYWPYFERTPARSKLLIGWVGAVAVGAAVVSFSAETTLPGHAALLPTLGAAALIIGGDSSGPRASTGRVLSVAPLRYIGDRSYALYLWHWPFLIIGAQSAGSEMSIKANLALLAGAFLVSILTYRLVEKPIHDQTLKLPVPRSLTRRGSPSPDSESLFWWPACLLPALGVAAGCLATIGGGPGPETSGVDVIKSGSLSGETPAAVRDAVEGVHRGSSIPAELVPSVETAVRDRFAFAPGCTPQPEESESGICPLGVESAERELVVFGDSKAQMWMPALIEFAERHGWKLLPISKSSCTPSGWAGYLAESAEPSCLEWYRWGIAQMQEIEPDALLIAVNYREATADADYNEFSLNGVSDLLDAVSHAQPTVVLGDVPGQELEPADCLLSADASMADCAHTLTEFQIESTKAIGESTREHGARFIDPTPWLCFEGVCPMVVGETPTHADRGHASDTTILQLEDLLTARLRLVLPQEGGEEPGVDAGTGGAAG